MNEDGELGLAYQGLKQVARSNVWSFFLCLLFCLLMSLLDYFSARGDARVQLMGTGQGGVSEGSPLHRRLSLCAEAACLRQEDSS